MTDLPADRWTRLRSVLLGAAAFLCLSKGLAQITSDVCASCTGVIAVLLPWFGSAFYGVLAAVSAFRPRHPSLSWTVGFYVFLHACLMAESVLDHRLCPFCIGVAAIAFAAAAVQCVIRKADLPSAVAALVLGAAAAVPRPYERVEDAATRKFWPAKILAQAPAFVDRNVLSSCGHDADVRVLIYEDEKSCRSCSSVTRRILPALAADFPTRICIHSNTLSPVPKGQAMPVMVLVSKSTRMTVIEGYPVYEELKPLLESLLAEFKHSHGTHP